MDRLSDLLAAALKKRGAPAQNASKMPAEALEDVLETAPAPEAEETAPKA